MPPDNRRTDLRVCGPPSLDELRAAVARLLLAAARRGKDEAGENGRRETPASDSQVSLETEPPA